MRIGLLGDVHGNIAWMRYALDKFQREGIRTIIQVGDFGIWPTGQRYVRETAKLLESKGQTMYIVPGNHEDYDKINAIPVGPGGWQYLDRRLVLAPRGHRWIWENREFVALGGAPSVDRTARLRSKYMKVWWSEEAITDEDVAATIEGGRADVMIGHDAPVGIEEIDRQIGSNPHGFVPQDLDYAHRGRMKMTEAVMGVKPKVFVHGHYHFRVDEWVSLRTFDDPEQVLCHVLGLNKDGSNHSLGSLDTETLEVESWDLLLDYTEWRNAA